MEGKGYRYHNCEPGLTSDQYTCGFRVQKVHMPDSIALDPDFLEAIARVEMSMDW